jgi:hypothetical protein
MDSSPLSKLWNAFIRIQRQVWLKIDCFTERRVKINARNGGTFDELYSAANKPDFQKKNIFRIYDTSLFCCLR